jgi:phytoene desaturase
MSKKIIVIGSGFAGLSAACFLARDGYAVTLLEKNAHLGGRARMFETDGFRFDMGPSWYWMPDVFEHFFGQFGKKPSDYYNLIRLSPSYRVVFAQDDFLDIPADYNELRNLFESIEKGAAAQLDAFMDDAAYKYEVGINDLVHRPSRSLLEFADWRVLKGLVQLDLLNSFATFARKYFKHEKLLKIIEFPVLFLGATPQNTPALYSLMNYADLKLGTWYPEGGMHEIIKGMVSLAEELGVNLHTNATVTAINVKNRTVSGVTTADGRTFEGDAVVAGADYHHIEQQILAKEYRHYTEKYWDKRTMAPSSLLFYIGLNTKLNNVLHHNLFFDEDFNQHAVEIYDAPTMPTRPLFYASCPSQTDATVAPADGENLFLLMPTAPDMPFDEAARDHYLKVMLDRLEAFTGQDIAKYIVYKRSFAHEEFISEYNSFKGNAYGLANTLKQTAILKPSLKNSKLDNLYFAGQLTVPGPGVPPSLISGEVVAKEVLKEIGI